MRKAGNALSIISFILLVVLGAAAQERSLADLGKTEKFTAAEIGVSIALFKDPTEIKRSDDGSTEFRWSLKEGLISIDVGDYLPPKEKPSAQTRAGFLKGYKQGFMEQSHVKYISESGAAIGPYIGTTYIIEIPSRNLRIRDTEMTYARRYISITAGHYTNMQGSEALVLKALRSIVLTAPPK